jgi:hypothetical protein
MAPPAAALDRARALLDRPPPAVPPGQLAVDDPRPVIPAGDPEPLFDLAPYTSNRKEMRS